MQDSALCAVDIKRRLSLPALLLLNILQFSYFSKSETSRDTAYVPEREIDQEA
jgi:hypothetical protein